MFVPVFSPIFRPIFSGIEGLPPITEGELLEYQDRCSRFTQVDTQIFILDAWFRQNQIIRLVDNPVDGYTVILPSIPRTPYGSRVTILNHDEADVTITGGRFTTVNSQASVTTNDPWIDVINSRTTNDSIYVDFNVISSKRG